MTDNTRDKVSLLARVAQECGVAVELLEDLAALEKDVPDLSVWGAKAEFTRSVGALLDAGARKEKSR